MGIYKASCARPG